MNTYNLKKDIQYSFLIFHRFDISYQMVQVKTGTFSTYRFTPDNTSFHNPRDQSANECYCLEENTSDCLPSGLLDISGCTPGTKI